MATNDKQEQALLSQLLHESKLYRTGKNFQELLDFVNRLPNFAPFNAFLLQIQKPGLKFAATAYDWKNRFNRTIKEGARPLIILWPFAPIALVYDMDDTDGGELPKDVAHAFKATGDMTGKMINGFTSLLAKQGINVKIIEYGDGHAGHIERPEHDLKIGFQSMQAKEKPDYEIRLNKSHNANVQFATLAHELAHLYLGHLGKDAFLKIPNRHNITHEIRELEAESVCYIVCHRNGVKPNSDQYLSGFVKENTRIETMDVYALLKTAGKIETVLGLIAHASFQNTTSS
ncbi:MAG: hypothetical protein QX189_16670 [Methylococcales bacterium]